MAREPEIRIWTRPQRRVAGAVAAVMLVAYGVRWWTDRVEIRGGGDRVGEIDSRVDPNVASEEVLTALPGLSRSQARAIVAAREGGRVFRSAEDLGRVKGVGPGAVEAARETMKFGR